MMLLSLKSEMESLFKRGGNTVVLFVLLLESRFGGAVGAN